LRYSLLLWVNISGDTQDSVHEVGISPKWNLIRSLSVGVKSLLFLGVCVYFGGMMPNYGTIVKLI